MKPRWMMPRLNTTMHGCLFACALVIAGVLLPPAADAAEPLLQPFAAAGSAPAAPWTVVGLPHQTKPFTRFSVVDLDGLRALRVEADSSYGNLVHPMHRRVVTAHLAWQWRIDEPLPHPDLHERQGDDTALKVCVMWDLPLERVPFIERQVLRIARSKSDVELPAATVCYVWDPTLPPDTRLDSPFTRRLRYMVLRGGEDPLHRWTTERRDIVADFAALFGDEAQSVPELIGIAIGADADNTHAHSVGHVALVSLEP